MHMYFNLHRFSHLDSELGMVIEPEDLPQDTYPFQLVDDPALGVKGSCLQYHTRTDVTEEVKRIESFAEVTN